MRKALDTCEEWKPQRKLPPGLWYLKEGPMVTDLRFIWSELQELLEHSAYAVKGEKCESIYEKCPISLKNELSRNIRQFRATLVFSSKILESLRTLKLSKFESFRALKLSKFANLGS